MTRRVDFAVSAAAVLVLLAPTARGAEAVVTVTVEVVAACAEDQPAGADCRPIRAPAFAEQPYVLSPELESLRRAHGGDDAPPPPMPLVTVVY
jgi:hypothetical protein